jgi:uncharacterized cupredoxin-like copper-binding protein
MRIRILPVTAIVALAAGVLMVGCGDDSTTGTGTETAASGGGEEATLEIKMGDFYFEPKDATAEPGPTTIVAPNEGSVEHELVLFKTNTDPAQLPTDANGDVDEEKLDEMAEEIGEVADVEPGDTKSEEFDLTPGKYVMFCNISGHYAQGMYGTLTVTE